MSKDRVAVEAKDGSTVWIDRDQVESWKKYQEDNSPEKQKRVEELADGALKLLLEASERGRNNTRK